MDAQHRLRRSNLPQESSSTEETLPRYSWIAHVDLDSFFASVEQLTRPTLRNRAVIVAGVEGRGVVAGASYEARKFGARSAMPTHQAMQRMGYAGVAVAPRFSVYKIASARVFSILEDYADILERVSVDEGYIASHELDSLTETEAYSWAELLQNHIFDETGLNVSIGMAMNKHDAKIGSDLNKPHGITVIPQHKREEILFPLSVGEMPGAGPVTQEKLLRAGIVTIGDLASRSQEDIDNILGGKVGKLLLQHAQGQDDTPVKLPGARKQISVERTFAQDLVTFSQVHQQVDAIAKLAYERLHNDGRSARTVTLKYKLWDFKSFTRSYSLPWATSDQDLLLDMAHQLTPNPALESVGAIRLLGVGFSGLSNGDEDSLLSDQELLKLLSGHSKHLFSVYAAPVVTRTDSLSQKTVTQQWRPSQDVFHPDFGHGWVQGSGFGKVTVRFETRTTAQSFAKTFPIAESGLEAADPINSLDWGEWMEAHPDVLNSDT